MLPPDIGRPGACLRNNGRTGTLKKGHRADCRCASAPGGDTMNKTDLAAHVAAQVALPKVAADRAVSAVFAAIGDALARDEAVAIAGFGTLSTRSRAPRVRGGTRKRARPSPSPPPGRRRSRPGRSSAISSTVVNDSARPYPIDLPGGSRLVQVRDGDPAFAARDRHTRRFMGLEPASHSLHPRQATSLQRGRRSRPGIRAVDNRATRTRRRGVSQSDGMFVAERGFVAPPIRLARADMRRTHLEIVHPPRHDSLYGPRPTTEPPADARQSYQKRFHFAYGLQQLTFSASVQPQQPWNIRPGTVCGQCNNPGTVRDVSPRCKDARQSTWLHPYTF